MLLCKEYKKQSESIINRISTNKLYNPMREFPGSWEIGYNLAITYKLMKLHNKYHTHFMQGTTGTCGHTCLHYVCIQMQIMMSGD